MPLDYLIFDPTDEEDGACSFDAMASVLPDRLPSLLREVEAVLAWAHRAFGAADPEGEWDFELQATGEGGEPVAVSYDGARAQVALPQAPAGRLTLALTVTGSAAFADAFRTAFPDAA
jgi:hypothetical protein